MDYSKVINAIHSPVSDPQRSGKDLSHRKVFTMKCGELLPVLCKELVPKDYVEVDIAALVRTLQPLNTAAFMRSRLHFDFFFVPMTSIWRNFDKFYYQRDDNFTSYTNGSAYEPNITLENLCNACFLGSQTSPVDSQGARYKLADLLGYGNWIDYAGGTYISGSDFTTGGDYAAIANKSLTALPYFAYQRIFNMHYRDAWLDQPTSNAVKSMSADYLGCSSYATSLVNATTSGTDQNPELCKMRYHRYARDLFMGLLPSQQFGSVSTIEVNLSDLEGHLFLNSNTVGTSGAALYGKVNSDKMFTGIGNSASNTSGPYTVLNSGVSTFDVITLRKALAAQKWKEYNARAGWKSGKQAKAMFGVNTPDDRKHDVEFIDGYQFPIMVDEVVATAQTDYTQSGSTKLANLGELAGKVIGVGNGHKIKFSSGERFGYFFCIAYVLPQAEYNSFGIDKQLVRSVPEDHFMPAYQNLGLEPVFKFELNAQGLTNVFDSTLGYAPRYHEYKTEYDKVYGEFSTGGTLSSWVTIRRDLANAVNSGVIPTSLLYVNPFILDSVFIANADPSQETDQFMCNCNFDLKMVRPMSDLGLPTL